MDKQQSMQAAAYDYIKNKIARCEYMPNQMLSESLIQEELNCSRTPIRAAIARLTQEGLLKVLPKRGIIVSGFSLNEIKMIFEVRTLIEPYSLRNYGTKLDMNEMMKFRKIFLSFFPEVPSFEKLKEDDDFHSFLISPLPNIYLKDLYRQIQTQNTRLRVLTRQVAAERPQDTAKEHLQIIDACLIQDWEGAAKAAEQHLEISKKNSILALLQGQVEQNIIDVL